MNSTDSSDDRREDPQARRWLWVLTVPLTVNRDSMLVLEDESGDYVPVFEDRENAESFRALFAEKAADDYNCQAMHLFDLQKFACEKGFLLTTLDGQGQILERWRPIGRN
ncbi:MAG: hypothetical protein LBT62_08715 [Deltaproteobacteria bacterium]|jgi:hypothetical protein|nr:hypothetical protein [Deltaproteobacteria bacterium]